MLAYGRVVRKDTPTTGTEERSGPNRHGRDHWQYMGDAKSGDKTYFFGVSITRVGDKAVLIMLEGTYRSFSDIGRAREARAFREQADVLLGSVK
jgi:hypothetical protein